MSEKQTFETGDLVYLKSGGPPMTFEKMLSEAHSGLTEDYQSKGTVRWFDGSKLCQAIFRIDDLVLCEDQGHRRDTHPEEINPVRIVRVPGPEEDAVIDTSK